MVVPGLNLINEADLGRNFKGFFKKMRCRWYFKHEPSSNFINVLVLRPKSQWKPPAGNPCVELFLSRLEEELFLFLSGNPQSYNPTKEK